MALLPARADGQAVESLSMIARARQLEDLRADGAMPFVLLAQIKATKGKQESHGTYSLTWVNANRWHEELLLDGFSRIRDGVDGGYRQVRNSNSSPVVIFRVDETLDIAKAMQLSPEAEARNARRRKIGSGALSCVELRHEEFVENKELCFDPTSGLLVHSEHNCLGLETVCILDYADSVELGDRRFPSQIRSRSPDEISIEITVASLKAFSGSVASLPVADPARSEFWRACRDEIPAKAVNVPPLVFFDKTKRGHEPQTGVLLVDTRIEPDGTVSRVTPLVAGLVQFENAATGEASSWKFKPAMCSGAPVRVETLISVTYGVGGPP
jgi:hypothetical protein